jgi:ATP-dependent 26S proteasome regulatory subunit
MNSAQNLHNELDNIFSEISGKECETTFDELKQKLTNELQFLSAYLNTTSDEALVFSVVLLGTIHSEMVSMEELKKKLGFRAIEVFKLEQIKVQLIEKGLIKQEKWRSRSFCFYIEISIYDQISKGQTLVPKNHVFSKNSAFFEELDVLFEQCVENEINTNQFIQILEKIELNNPQLPVFKIRKKTFENWPEFILFLFVCNEYAKGEEEVDYLYEIKKIFAKVSTQIELKIKFQKRNSIYLLNDYLEFKENNFRSSNSIKLTDKAILEIFEDLGQEVKKEFIPIHSQLIVNEKIEKKGLYFEGRLKENLSMIKSAINPKRFEEIKKAFAKKGMKESVTGIFYGHPGTGKTESIYQLARETKRNIIMVDISSIRDKFVGESEKRLKAVFNNYRKACEHFESTPILLFNEADALFGKRIDVKDSVDQMNNAMQNILLQELEDFKGIFLATTNLAASLDPAFERRFLFKVKFEKASPAIRAKIWMEKFKGSINKSTAAKLGQEFEFSGGEIDNIAKKALVQEIVLQKKLDYELLKNFCEQEFLMAGNKAKPIGFAA